MYAEPWRRYHTLQHLEECLALFSSTIGLAQRPSEVEAGLWFHDAIYDLRATDNEERSASLARSVLLDASVSQAVVERVAGHVLATKHHAATLEPDARLLVDIDLSILGAQAARFAEYEQQIRVEYAFVPDALFFPKRREILAGFLARPRIFYTEHFSSKLEQSARANLASAIAASAA